MARVGGLAGMVLLMVACAGAAPLPPRILQSLDIAPVWAGHPVGFDLLTTPQGQFVAFYDAQRRMTVASRTLDSSEWKLKVLPSSIQWDSHNYLTLTHDDEGLLHLAGNMHCVPLIYFRTAKPWDVETFQQIPSMVGREEQRCTYPRFFRGPAQELIFTYRDGRSGSGNQIYNVYEPASHTWRRLLDRPLTDGQGKMNAYLNGPARGPDGFYHLCWVWRNTPDCATNHSISYARSRDLVHWETGAGKSLSLPMTLSNSEVVDPVPPGGGAINGNVHLGFDSRKRPVITYHKYDAAGNTQVYNARLEDGAWKIYQTSEWTYRWDFSGGGTIHFEIRLGAVAPEADGTLSLSYSNPKHGSGIWRLDEKTLKPIGTIERQPTLPRQLHKAESDFPGMAVKWKGDSGASGERGVHYWLRWETLGENRDRPRPGPLPSPSLLRVYKIQVGE